MEMARLGSSNEELQVQLRQGAHILQPFASAAKYGHKTMSRCSTRARGMLRGDVDSTSTRTMTSTRSSIDPA